MIPDHVTRQQLADAFAAMGLDAGEILSWRGNAHDRYLELLMLPRGMPDVVESVLVKIPIHDEEPQADRVEPTQHGYTPHGHPCCGYATIGERPSSVARCGGVRLCGKCQWEASRIHDAAPPDTADLLGELRSEGGGT